MSTLLSFGLILTVLPAFLVILLGQSLIRTANGELRSTRRWSLFLLGAAVALSFPFALFANHLFENWGALLALLFLPALLGILALLAINWRSIVGLWRSDRTLAGILLALLVIQLALTTLGEPYFLPALLIGSLVVAAVWVGIQRIQGGYLLAAGVISIILLIADASGLASSPAIFNNPSFRMVYGLSTAIVPFLALTVAALLIHSALKVHPESDRLPWPGKLSLLLLAGLILLSLAAAVFRSAVMVHATGRGFEDHLPFLIIMAAVIAGMFLALTGVKPGLYVGLFFTIFCPILFLVVYAAGWRLNPHAITISRAGRIAQALREVHQETGSYPQDLDSLTPGYLPFLLGPLNGRGQRWCYQAGENYYRLGSVFFQRYYNPEMYYKIEVHSGAGEPPQGPWMCDEELQRMKDTGGL